MQKLKSAAKHADKNIVALIAIVLLIMGIMSYLVPDKFFSLQNLKSMGTTFPEYGILSFGMMLAMISGGIDLSLIGIANLSAIVASITMVSMGGDPMSIVLAVVFAFVVGALCGLFNGFLIGHLQIPPMLVTLAGLQLYTGAGVAITGGPAVTGIPESFCILTSSAVAGIPTPMILFLVLAVVIAFILKSTVYGRQLLFMGTNQTASKYSGINNFRITMITYLISGLLGSVSGLIMTASYASAKADTGSSYTLLTLLIVVLGGTNPDGGKGSVLGVSLAVIVLQMVSSAFSLLRINAFIKTFVWGLILIGVMVGMYLVNRKSIKSGARQ